MSTSVTSGDTKHGPFRLAVVGCGRIAVSHVEAALNSRLAEVTALVDPVAERAQALGNRFSIHPRIAQDVAALGNGIDGAIIATPNATHADLAERCLTAGISVLIEKPLAVKPEEGQLISDIANRTGGTVAVGYVSRFRTSVRLLGTLIREAYFGRVHRFAYQFGSKGGWAPVSGYNLDLKTSGGGVLVTTGTHFIDRMLDWFGYPESVSLVDDSDGGPEANAIASFTFRGGCSGVARFSKTIALPAGFVMETDHGTVILKDRDDAQIMFYPAAAPNLVHAVSGQQAMPSSGDAFVDQLEDFIDAVRTRKPPMVTAAQGQMSLRLIDELYRHRQQRADAAEVLR